MFRKIVGLILLAAGLFFGFSILIELIGTAIGILFFLLKIAVPLVLVYLGYRFLFSDRSQ